MAYRSEARSKPSSPLSSLLLLLGKDWIPLLLDLYYSLRQLITLKGSEGLYEILDYDTTLELLYVQVPVSWVGQIAEGKAYLKRRSRLFYVVD